MSKKPVSKGKSLKTPRLPVHWSDISAGCLVLSFEDDIADGFWPAVVQAVKNDVATLKWQKRLDRRPFKKAITDLALFWPGQDLPSGGEAEAGGKGPTSWSALGVGHEILAGEDGPLGQFWPGKIIEQLDGERLSIEWVGYPDVPPVERSRRSLALLHPSDERSVKLRAPKQ
ncbi:hypothetical protein [Undibacter mobilis]|uniref:Uncharacterized protein n=1 Tax=Undibacter mobilis TaxID=2292256 RepID=A0A371BAH9_9BRAD|nr:hypothetical protein [Undibacter mobilis]RDV04517.1 hypothetical protein DXH78_08040 [Undibacter mobilis]